MTEKDCIFCRILRKEIPSQMVLETDDLIAFKDLNPQAPTHLLLVSKKHIPRLSEAGDDDAAMLGRIQLAARDLAVKAGLTGGFRLVTNNGRGAGQSVDHLHYHLLAGRPFEWPPG